MKMKNEAEMLEALESDGIIKKEGDLWGPGPKYEQMLKPVPVKLTEPTFKSQSKPFCEGLTEKRDMEIKQSLLAMSVRFLKRGKNWTVQRIGNPAEGMLEHILISTQPVKSVQFVYYPPAKKKKG